MLFVFLSLLLGVADCGQVVFAHQALVERARAAARWASIHDWQGPEPIVNLVLYGQTQEPPIAAGYLGMTPANVQVTYRPPLLTARTMKRSASPSSTSNRICFRPGWLGLW